MPGAPTILAGLLAAIAPAAAQSLPGTPAETADTAPSVPIDSLPAALRLGIRAESTLRQFPVLSTVVIVPDARSYITAIDRWSLRARFPVLIDDGSPQATEDIGRFIRAFTPKSVVRWSGGHTDDRPGGLRGTAIRDAVDLAVAHAWEPAADAPDQAAVARERWKELNLTPAGIVVADPSDKAWTAALALAAGRGQPIVWLDAPAGVNRSMKPEEAKALETSIEAACAGWPYTWAGLGDDLDSVTLCLNSPVKIETAEKEWTATTDQIGRRDGTRWAWAGQVEGDEARAAYNAMCALFLRTDASWHFESYPSTQPWADYGQDRAAATLRQAGLSASVLGGPLPGDDGWRLAASRPIDAGLICVNSKGTRDFFDLAGARLQPGAVPFLLRPAMVYFIHSWSANAPANRTTVAGRWLERGVYAYLGSVQEPMLTAFVPTPIFASRLASGAAWGAAVRPEPAAPWKLAVFGDPLVTLGTALGPWPTRADAPLPLVGAADLDAADAEAGKQYAQAVRALVMLGRDEQAAALAQRILDEDIARFDSALAEAAIMPAFRTGRRDLLLRAFAGLSAQRRADGALRDALWNALAPDLPTTADAAIVAVLSENLREDQLGRDAVDLAPAIDRARGQGAGNAFLGAVRQRATDPRDIADLDKALGIADPPRRTPRRTTPPRRSR